MPKSNETNAASVRLSRRRSTEELVITTFNLRASVFDARRHWLLRRRAAQRVLLDHPASLIGLQEVFRLRYADLNRMLPSYQSFLGGRGGACPLNSYNPVFWQRVTTRILDRGSFWLGPTPAQWCRDSGAKFARTATWIVIEHSGKQILFVNTHLDHASGDCRLRSADALISHSHVFRQRGIPVIIAGDFNALPGSPEHVALLRAGFKDSWVVAHPSQDSEGHTFHGFAGKHRRRSRIDWIFFSEPLVLQGIHVVRDFKASDHFAVIARFL